jgi:hypothetical protein
MVNREINRIGESMAATIAANWIRHAPIYKPPIAAISASIPIAGRVVVASAERLLLHVNDPPHPGGLPPHGMTFHSQRFRGGNLVAAQSSRRSTVAAHAGRLALNFPVSRSSVHIRQKVPVAVGSDGPCAGGEQLDLFAEFDVPVNRQSCSWQRRGKPCHHLAEAGEENDIFVSSACRGMSFITG